MILLGSLFIPAAIFSQSAVWQWSIDVKGGIDKRGPSKAFLWIPENCQRVRGVILAQHNMEEISILENPIFRKAMTDLGFAEIWCAPPFDHLFRFTEGAAETFNGMMRELADVSGYDELNHAPVIGLGHSAAASWPYYFAAWNPGRTLAAISVSGQWPYFRNPVFAPDIWGDRNIDFVPCLETMGEYEAADTWSKEGLKERQEHPLMPLSMLACPAEGHFAATNKKVEYIVLYIKKVVQYRLTNQVLPDGSIKLNPIDPTKTGWLVDKWRLNQMPKALAAAVGEYTGDPTEAFWFFDEELVKATEAYEAEYRGMKAQLLGYVQDGKVVRQKNTHLQVDLSFQPEQDGITFTLHGTFLDTVPGESPRPAIWTGLSTGSPIGHTNSTIPVSIDKICGPFIKTGPETFEVRFDRTGMGKVGDRMELCFAATHPGDNEYKPAVQQAHMIIPTRISEGADQTIIFPSISDQKVGKKTLKLKAKSSKGAKVYYYILAGPAEIEGDEIRFTTVPPRAKFPMRVTVVAWQYGRMTALKLKTAEPVERTFWFIK